MKKENKSIIIREKKCSQNKSDDRVMMLQEVLSFLGNCKKKKTNKSEAKHSQTIYAVITLFIVSLLQEGRDELKKIIKPS